jgi:hypothetical protein
MKRKVHEQQREQVLKSLQDAQGPSRFEKVSNPAEDPHYRHTTGRLVICMFCISSEEWNR